MLYDLDWLIIFIVFVHYEGFSTYGSIIDICGFIIESEPFSPF